MEGDDLIKCYFCHKNLLQERIINGELVRMPHPERVETEFYLNNNSRMTVSLCMSCKKGNDLNDPTIHNSIMENIIKGWESENKILLSRGLITKEDSDKIINNHRQLSILFKSENMNDYQIKQRSS